MFCKEWSPLSADAKSELPFAFSELTIEVNKFKQIFFTVDVYYLLLNINTEEEIFANLILNSYSIGNSLCN